MSVDNHNILSNNSIEVIIITNCTNCGSVVDQGSKFCGACGTPVVTQQLRCPHCKSEVDQNDRFCGDCGNSISIGAATTVAGQNSTDAVSFTEEGDRSIYSPKSIIFASAGAIMMLVSMAIPWYRGSFVTGDQYWDISQEAVNATDFLSNSAWRTAEWYDYYDTVWALFSLPIILFIVLASITAISCFYSYKKSVGITILWILLGDLAVLCVVISAAYFFWLEYQVDYELTNVIYPGSVVALLGALIVKFSGIIGRRST